MLAHDIRTQVKQCIYTHICAPLGDDSVRCRGRFCGARGADQTLSPTAITASRIVHYLCASLCARIIALCIMVLVRLCAALATQLSEHKNCPAPGPPTSSAYITRSSASPSQFLETRCTETIIQVPKVVKLVWIIELQYLSDQMKVFQTSSCLSYLLQPPLQPCSWLSSSSSLLPTSSLSLLSTPPCDIKSMLHAVDGLVEVAKKAVDVTKLPVSSSCRLRNAYCHCERESAFPVFAILGIIDIKIYIVCVEESNLHWAGRGWQWWPVSSQSRPGQRSKILWTENIMMIVMVIKIVIRQMMRMRWMQMMAERGPTISQHLY